jgi:hypothetical protein
MKVKLEQLYSSHSKMRTKFIEGHAQDIPVVGNQFVMISRTLDMPSLDDSYRYFKSSTIQEVSRDGDEITFRTMYSTYKITILDDN